MASVHEPHAHHGPTFRTYMVIAFALSVFTISSFVFNSMSRMEPEPMLSAHQAFVLILGVAVIKAVLVGMYFMHLKFEWGKLYFIIVPIFILAIMMAMVLLPDTVIAWEPSHDPLDPPVSTSGTR
jgi:cytochrome c oxidase subunit 4